MSQIKFPLAVYFAYSNAYVSVLLYQFVPLSFHHVHKFFLCVVVFLLGSEKQSQNGLNQLGIWGLAGVLCQFLRRSVNPYKVNFSFCTHIDCLHVVPDSIFGSAAYSPSLFYCNTHSETGERNGNPLQYSWLENPMDRGA